MAETPVQALSRCRAVQALRPACPERLPGASEYVARTFIQGQLDTFNIETGGSRRAQSLNRPPAFVHVVLQTGDLAQLFETFVVPLEARAESPRDGLMRSEERRAGYPSPGSGKTPTGMSLGTAEWNGRTGRLMLVPPFEVVASIHGDHLLFLWSEQHQDFALSLHAWEPFTESVITLQEVVGSLYPPQLRAAPECRWSSVS